jgi:hypothetical protein
MIYPNHPVRQMLERLKIHNEEGFVDNITKGFWAADLKLPVDDKTVEDWPVELRAAYYAHRGMAELGQSHRHEVVELVGKINAIWDKWQQMNGDNRPLVRSKAGERRDYDINLDGMAHYGMLPDFIQDLRNDGLTAEDLAPFFRSAYDYVQMWETCTNKAAEMQTLPRV